MAAPAKVNLHLRVLGRRPDGYHDVVTIFQAIDLADDVSVEITDADGPIELRVEGADVGPMADNLATRAARAYRAATGLSEGVRIALVKRIPAGAGLGGGSSDAAAVLKCLAELTGDDDRSRLSRIAASLGSDVAFFLGPSPLALGTGRGNVLTPLTPLPERDLLLVLPPVHVATVDAYGRLAEGRSRAAPDVGDAPGATVGASDAAPRDTEGARLLETLGASPTWSALDGLAHNDFQAVLADDHPEISRSLSALSETGAHPVLLSGSGSASFGFFERADRAESRAAVLCEELGWRCVAARILGTMPAPGRVAAPM